MTDTFIKAGNWFTAAATRIITKGALNLDLFLKEKYLPGFNKPAIVGFNEDNKPIWGCFIITHTDGSLEFRDNAAVAVSDAFIRSVFDMETFFLVGGTGADSTNAGGGPVSSIGGTPTIDAVGTLSFTDPSAAIITNEVKGLIYFTADLK